MCAGVQGLPDGWTRSPKQNRPGCSIAVMVQTKGNSGLGDFVFRLTDFLSLFSRSLQTL